MPQLQRTEALSETEMPGAATRSSASTTSTRPAALACAECRKKHLRCDGATPICSRCAHDGLHCSYMPSRRGQKRKERDEEPSQRYQNAPSEPSTVRTISSPPPRAETSEVSELECGSPKANKFDFALPDTPSSNNCRFRDSAVHSPHQAQPMFRLAVTPPEQQQQPSTTPDQDALFSTTSDDWLVNLFYDYFHDAHPILVPRHLYHSRAYPKYLALVVQFIGSHYSSLTSSDSLKAVTAAELAQSNDRSACMVQARLLYTIALHARGERVEGHTMLVLATDLAFEIGLHQKDFAISHAPQQPLESESLRRTWWELYVIDGYMAILHRKAKFRSNTVICDVPLPCEESVYDDGSEIPDPPSKVQFDNRLFADEEITFSSFCYRIDAVRILARVLAVSGMDHVDQDQIQAVDNALVSWANHLPSTKTDLVNCYGKIDEMLLQAHMVIHHASILLHLPRSNLNSDFPATNDMMCGPMIPHLSPSSTRHIHAVKATAASKQLTNLVSVCSSLRNHSPLFIFSLLSCGIVQLSACTAHSSGCLEQHRDRVTLILGLLKSLSQNWDFSKTACQWMRKVSAGVFRITSEPMPMQQGIIHESCVNIPNVGTVDDNSWLSIFTSTEFQGLSPLGITMPFAG